MKKIVYDGDKSICVYPKHVPKDICKEVVRPIRNGCPAILDSRLDEKIHTYLASKQYGVLPHYYTETKISQYLPKLVPDPKLYDFGHYTRRFKAGERFRFSPYLPWPTIISVFMVVNAPRMGGEFEFLNQKVRYKPDTGDVLVFPSGWSYVFKINTVKQGTLDLIHTGITLEC